MNKAAFIDYTLLKPDCSLSDIKKLCEEALHHKFYAVCIPPYFVKDAAYIIDEKLKIATVAGFPMGYSAIPAKVEEIKRSIDEGADEIDLVINHCAVKSGFWSNVRNEIDGTARAAAMKGKVFKTIIEPHLLTEDEVARICSICTEVGVNYLSLGSGFCGNNGRISDVQRLRKLLPPSIKIKVTGDFSASEVQQAIDAGANRIGASNGIALL